MQEYHMQLHTTTHVVLPVVKGKEYRKRDDLGLMLNELGLTGEGAEVGVQQGIFSKTILDHWKGRKLYSIDPWMTFDPKEYIDMANTTQENHNNFYQETVDKLSVYGERSQIVRKTSVEGSKEFQDGQLDFVYIDAQHHYEAVVEDIQHWYPKVKKGGVMAGHDYVDGLSEVYGLFGVMKAVNEFVKKSGLQLFIFDERNSDSEPLNLHPSWMVITK